jgi:hypothetical protein
MKKVGLVYIAFTLLSGMLAAQDTLPNFTVKNMGNNRIIIGWVNNLTDVKQISIQRSFDSVTGYKTILTVPDPAALQNGYADMKAINDHMFYRLYIQQEKGMYQFSKAKRPFKDTSKSADPVTITEPITKTDPVIIPGNTLASDSVKIADSVTKAKPFVVKIDGFPGTDSIAAPNPVTVKNKPTAFVPSLYVYTNRDGYVRVSLPDEEKPKKYAIKFFDEDNTLLFELKDIKQKTFKLDKTNFYHAGWFRFELYEDGKLLEKHKFYLEKDF